MTRSLLLFPLLLAHLLASAAQQIPYCQVSQNRPEDGLATDLGAQPPRAQPLLLLGPWGCRTGPQARCRPSCSLAGAPSPEPAAASRTLASRTLPPDTCHPRALQRLTGIRYCVECLNKKCFYCNYRTSPIWTGSATNPVLSEVRLSWRRKAPAQLARQLRDPHLPLLAPTRPTPNMTQPLWLCPLRVPQCRPYTLSNTACKDIDPQCAACERTPTFSANKCIRCNLNYGPVNGKVCNELVR